ncbi:MAG: YraN family protein [Clostridiales bacterium]|nr:YraN family protein [Clostridiales bacterium]
MPNSQKDFHKKFLGKVGEKKAVAYMKKLGYKLIKANYVTPFGEADAVMEKDGVTVFLEVKTRSNRLFGDPKDAVNYSKQDKYRKIAEYYCLSNENVTVSFAVIEIVGEELNLILDAF